MVRVIVMLTDKQIHEFKKILNDRDRQLREEIRQELLKSDDQRFINLAGEVYDLEEASVADLLVDLDLAILDMHIEEIRDIDAAQKRIAEGGYGLCIDCDVDIAIERLRVYPTAKRCRSCQSKYEGSHAGRGTPSL